MVIYERGSIPLWINNIVLTVGGGADVCCPAPVAYPEREPIGSAFGDDVGLNVGDGLFVGACGEAAGFIDCAEHDAEHSAGFNASQIY